MADSHSDEVVIPSDTAEGQRVQQEILAALEASQYSQHDIFGIHLALEEALVNAIKHGNRMDRSKTVRIAYHVNAEYFEVEIEDQGEGFNLDDVPDPTAEENLERPCGRGIMLMRSFMSSVEYTNAGNCVIMRKLRENSTPA
jgi:serine/threonine-protein kinase RsbW